MKNLEQLVWDDAQFSLEPIADARSNGVSYRVLVDFGKVHLSIVDSIDEYKVVKKFQSVDKAKEYAQNYKEGGKQ